MKSIDIRLGHLTVLRQQLHAAGLHATWYGALLEVRRPDEWGAVLSIRCVPRSRRDDRLWFFAGDEALASVVDVAGAVAMVRGRLDVRPSASERRRGRVSWWRWCRLRD